MNNLKPYVLTLSLMILPALILAQTVHQYLESQTDFVNPERGMYRYFETRTSGSYTPLDQQSLENLRSQDQQSLIYRIFYLDGFYSDPISTTVLDAIEQDFATLRASGVKALVRFAYTDELNYDEEDNPITPFNDTPEPALLFEHIHQLRPILQVNSDVILTVHNGFYGIWGENYYSDDFGTPYPGPITAQQQQLRDAVTDSLLAILPTDRTVSVRYPTLKSEYLDLMLPADSLTYAEAFTGTAKSRIAYHNDCFLADYNDYTFLDTLTEKPYWAAESRYLLMGGETCRDEPTYTQCTNALPELERFHWTYLNDDYHPNVLQRWQQEGCFDEIRRKLGYRLVLREATLPDAIDQNELFSLSLEIENIGWAAPMLPRAVQLVFRHTTSQEEFFLSLAAIDLRRCGGGQVCSYNLTLESGQNIPPGEYDLLLFLPDGRSNLQSDPKFAIRLANQDIWEAASGMHDLQHSLSVMGTTCPLDTTLSVGPLVTATYRAANNLRVETAIAAEARARFEAGELIQFLPGFSTLSGSEMEAVIQDCPEPALLKEQQPVRRILEKAMKTNANLQLGPNPFHSNLNISFQGLEGGAPEFLQLVLSDLYGRPLRQFKIHSHETITLRLPDLPPGLYLITWKNQEGQQTRKVIKQ
ncbi:DUF4832 domain-containing protein [Flavilitoribacter nigricans]|nr:DUF4832 domain-containing protein [Flavilitoribacter nigricans]